MNNVRVSCKFCGVSKAEQSAEVERLSHRVATLERQYGEMGTVAETAVARAEAAESKLSQLQLANEEKALAIAVEITDLGMASCAMSAEEHAKWILAILSGEASSD